MERPLGNHTNTQVAFQFPDRVLATCYRETREITQNTPSDAFTSKLVLSTSGEGVITAERCMHVRLWKGLDVCPLYLFGENRLLRLIRYSMQHPVICSIYVLCTYSRKG